ncbi:hypothetical protein [Solicola sp. PLA-1-18]|uniref:hypothetical protein n=1 Tax=Solicola sp. PLA-1-18 TaxID=3380532 RepID=UPI003B773BCA
MTSHDPSATAEPSDTPRYRELLVLDDAEVEVLDGPGARRIAPLPSRGEDPEVWQARTQVAAQRVVDQGWAERTDDALAPVGHAAAVLAARFSWTTVLVVEQHTGGYRDYLVAYLRADRKALLESVSQAGAHRFLATTAEVALEEVARFLMPVDGGQDGTGTDVDSPRETWTPQEWERQGAAPTVGAVMVSALVATRNHLATGDDSTVDQRRTSVFVLPDRTVVATGTPDGDLSVGTTTRASLVAEIASMTHLADEEA